MIAGCFQCVVIQHKYNEIQIDTIKIIVKNKPLGGAWSDVRIVSPRLTENQALTLNCRCFFYAFKQNSKSYLCLFLALNVIFYYKSVENFVD